MKYRSKAAYMIKPSLVDKRIVLAVIAFLIGILVYFLSRGLIGTADTEALYEAVKRYLLPGCAFLIFSIQLSAFSLLGSIIIPLVDVIIGFAFSLSLATIISSSGVDSGFIFRLIILSFAGVFLTLAFSAGSLSYSFRIFERVRKDKAMVFEIFKLLFLFILFTALLVLG